ncbi:anti-sigma regulatory factor [Alkalinema sp. FACHB-956]|uniref:ATP-binding protein n=1 Tax=Alkalinema sp. FACHB-956 TaxID=2692768 RepID=UPI00168A2445|nr:anti-sigma regulatory factor [Alkalinema sp. FACHB-956]MBD2325960.1 ATP-binding protein [Alkalinema sp. FACHB-956]
MKTELHVPSDLRFLAVVEHWLLDSLQLEIGNVVDWSRQSTRLRLALVEAYSNVVRHAHRDQPNLPVILRLELHDRDLALEIWDCGQGYNPSDYKPPTPEDKQEHGYGWLILNRLMDRVEYCLQVDGRNCLKLEANLPNASVEEDQKVSTVD